MITCYDVANYFILLIMLQDEILEEIHRIRQEYSRSFNYDLKAIFADL